MGGAVAKDARAVAGPAVGGAVATGDPTAPGAGGVDVAAPPEGVIRLVAVSSAAESPETMET
jgi:hypothetical protein